jgi:hypothetical protein
MIFDTLILVDISTNVNMRMECCEPLFGGVLEEEGARRTRVVPERLDEIRDALRPPVLDLV